MRQSLEYLCTDSLKIGSKIRVLGPITHLMQFGGLHNHICPYIDTYVVIEFE